MGKREREKERDSSFCTPLVPVPPPPPQTVAPLQPNRKSERRRRWCLLSGQTHSLSLLSCLRDTDTDNTVKSLRHLSQSLCLSLTLSLLMALMVNSNIHLAKIYYLDTNIRLLTINVANPLAVIHTYSTFKMNSMLGHPPFVSESEPSSTPQFKLLRLS